MYISFDKKIHQNCTQQGSLGIHRYMLDLRVEAEQRGAVQRMVQRLAPGATLSEKGAGHLSFSLPSAGLDLPTLFAQVRPCGMAPHSYSKMTTMQILFIISLEFP